MSRAASRAHKNAPSTLTSNMRLSRAAPISASLEPGATIPALFTSPSSGPNAANIATTAASSATSPGSSTPSPPAARTASSVAPAAAASLA